MWNVLLNMWVGLGFILVFAVARFMVRYRNPQSRISFSSKPNLYLSLGILFTFVGIFAGLQGFNTTNIQNSIPVLLNGLKTSFSSSILGIILSLLCPLFKKWENKGQIVEKQGVSADEIYALMKVSAEQNNDLLEKLIHSIAGDDDSSLSTHMSKLRNKFNDLQDEFKQFAENIGQASTDQIVEALQDVVTSFNEKITSQFGEHFKELNVAVKYLVVWQDNYKIYLEDHDTRMIKQSEEITQFSLDLTKVSETTKNLNEKIETISINMNVVNETIQAFKDHSNSLQNTLEDFSQISTNAKEAFPIIDNKLHDVTNIISNTMTEFMSNLDIQMETIQEKNIEISNTFSKTNENLVNSSNKLSESIQSITKTQQEGMEQTFNSFNSSMQQSLQEVFNTFDSQLSSITEKVSDDYSEVMNRVGEIVQKATGGRS